MHQNLGNVENTSKPFSFLIVGTIKDHHKEMSKSLKKLYSVFSKLGRTSVLVIESDSSDSSRNKISKFLDNNKFNFISLGNLSYAYPDRIKRLSVCRNRYVQEIRVNPKYDDFKFVVVADLDGINSRISLKKLKSALAIETAWDVLTPVQKYYYDILSLRHKIWSPHNYFLDQKFYSGIMSEYDSWDVSLYHKMLKISKKSEIIEVDSAFGGLGIYRKWVFLSCDYELESNELDNEHVCLHYKAKKMNAKIYIVPYLINSKINAHNKYKLFRHKIYRKLLSIKS